MTETAPWQTLEIQGLVTILLLSHRRAFDSPLLASDRPGTSRRLSAQELFNSSMAVLAHDNTSDPALTYANATALKLWHRSAVGTAGTGGLAQAGSRTGCNQHLHGPSRGSLRASIHDPQRPDLDTLG